MPEKKNVVGISQDAYPAKQAERGIGSTEIAAKVFREKSVMERNDPTGTRFEPPKPTTARTRG
jgi:hypothetical protein